MQIFNTSSKKLLRIKETAINKEKQIQEILENNLEDVFGLKFIDTEFSLNKLRIDTLAYDPENESFVIIEYKKDKNFTVIDQGFAYLSLLLNNKADFVLKYNEKTNKIIGKNGIDWSQSRVIFIAPEFTAYQIESINFKDLPIELWQIRLYSNNTMSLDKIKAKINAESIKTINKENIELKSVEKVYVVSTL
jgi:hypothetical protein